MCTVFDDSPNLAAGWGCCGCKTYNGIHRAECKFCDKVPCGMPGLEPREVLPQERRAAPDHTAPLTEVDHECPSCGDFFDPSDVHYCTKRIGAGRVNVITRCPECNRVVASYATLVIFALFLLAGVAEAVLFLLRVSR
jgi:hypothetical protein